MPRIGLRKALGIISWDIDGRGMKIWRVQLAMPPSKFNVFKQLGEAELASYYSGAVCRAHVEGVPKKMKTSQDFSNVHGSIFKRGVCLQTEDGLVCRWILKVVHTRMVESAKGVQICEQQSVFVCRGFAHFCKYVFTILQTHLRIDYFQKTTYIGCR